MRESFSINEILEAVNLILKSENKKKIIIKNKKRVIVNKNTLPIDTEKIITQAENYIKKKNKLLFQIFYIKKIIR